MSKDPLPVKKMVNLRTSEDNIDKWKKAAKNDNRNLSNFIETVMNAIVDGTITQKELDNWKNN